MKEEFQENMENLFNVITTRLEPYAVAVSLGAAMLFAAVMWAVYRLANTKRTYQPQFGITLVSLALLTTVLMELIQSNLALSLGMLGSLSIVRFRTNIKDPRDIAFIFWSMAIGITSATGSYFIGVAGSAVMACVMVFTRGWSSRAVPKLLVVRGSSSDIDAIQQIVDQMTANSSVKAKNILADSYELVYEVCVPGREENRIIKELFGLGGIDSVNLLAANA